MTFKYDCVWWWNGGTERGKWMQSDPGTRDECRRVGFVAYDGSTKIGPPEGPPSLAEIQEVLRPFIGNRV